jgi:glycosyltransferase involved in cell wall biosynthesis
MNRPIKILDLRDSPWVDGPGRTVLETAAALDRTQYVVLVGGFCSDKIGDSIYLTEARNRSLNVQPIVDRNALGWKIIPQILAAIDEHRVDILHTHDFRSNLAGLFCAWRRDLPVIATCHGWIANNMKGRIFKYFDMKLLTLFEQVVTVNEVMKKQLIASGTSVRKVEVIPNALIIDDWGPATGDKRFRRDLGVADTTRLLVNVGRLSAEKGQALLLDAVASIRTENPDICLVFVGIGPEENSLRAKASALGLANIVNFAGYRSNMSEVYDSADVVVQSSFTEGMPNVILESLMMQTPVIATDVGGTGEIIEHGVTGYLITPRSEQQLVNGILDFLQNESSHNEMARRGRNAVMENFNHDARVRRFAHLYSSLASNSIG